MNTSNDAAMESENETPLKNGNSNMNWETAKRPPRSPKMKTDKAADQATRRKRS